VRCVDPSSMSAADRLAELGEILAAAVQRFFARECKPVEQPRNREEQVDDHGRVEAPCGSPMESAP